MKEFWFPKGSDTIYQALHNYFYFLSSSIKGSLMGFLFVCFEECLFPPTVPMALFPSRHQEWPWDCEEVKKRLLQGKDLGICRWISTREPPSQAPQSMQHLKAEVQGVGETGLLHEADLWLPKDFCKGSSLCYPALALPPFWVWRIFQPIYLGGIQNLLFKYSGQKSKGC